MVMVLADKNKGKKEKKRMQWTRGKLVQYFTQVNKVQEEREQD